MSEQQPSIGRIVHFVLSNGFHRPAVLSGIHPQRFDSPASHDVELHVFTRPGDPWDGGRTWQLMNYAHRAAFDERGDPGTWHWPEREEVKRS
jgi:hypothetical protein